MFYMSLAANWSMEECLFIYIYTVWYLPASTHLYFSLPAISEEISFFLCFLSYILLFFINMFNILSSVSHSFLPHSHPHVLFYVSTSLIAQVMINFFVSITLTYLILILFRFTHAYIFSSVPLSFAAVIHISLVLILFLYCISRIHVMFPCFIYIFYVLHSISYSFSNPTTFFLF